MDASPAPSPPRRRGRDRRAPFRAPTPHRRYNLADATNEEADLPESQNTEWKES